MKRGPMIHGVLLVVVLIFAYQTWTREDKVRPTTGDVVVWKLPKDSITSILFDSKTKSVRIEKRTEAGETYLWGNQTLIARKPKKDTPGEEEVTTTDMVFAVGEPGEKVLEHFAELRALRELDLTEEKLSEYGLDDSDRNIALNYQEGGESKTRNLIVGGQIYGGQDRFVRDPDTGKGYAMASVVLKDLMAGLGGLQLRKYHLFEDDDLAKVVVTAGSKSRELTRITVDGEGEDRVKTKTWADVATPDKPDQTMSNFLKRVDGLRPFSYEPDITTDGLVLLAKIDYQDAAGKSLGWFEMWEKKPEPEPEPEPAKEAEPATEGADAAASGDGAQAAAGKDGGDAAAAKDGDAAAKDGDAAAKDGDAAAKDGDAAAEEPKQPDKPKAESAYYMRTERTRILTLLSQGSATRIADDIAQVFAE